MTLRQLKSQMLLPEKEIIIDKKTNIQGADVHLLSLTQEEDTSSLWLIHKNNFNEEGYQDLDDEYERRNWTNRDEILEGINRQNIDVNFFIGKMEIQNQTFNFYSSSGNTAYDSNPQVLMQIQHFFEKGLGLDEWEDIPLANLVISRYDMEDDLANIDENKDMKLKLEINPNSREMPIEHPFTISFGKQEKGKKVYYYDGEAKEEKYFFINEVYSFDIYEDIKIRAEEVEDLERRQEMIKHLTEAIERICPRDKNLAAIKYESPDGSQLNFYMKAYLDEPVKTYENGGSSVGIILGNSDKDLGINGYKLRDCVLQPIDKDFKGSLDLELFSRHISIPGETIRIE